MVVLFHYVDKSYFKWVTYNFVICSILKSIGLLKADLWTIWSSYNGWNGIVILWMVELWTSKLFFLSLYTSPSPPLELNILVCYRWIVSSLLWYHIFLCSPRNYNPVERRVKGGKERNSKGSHKSSKSLQANNLHNSASGDIAGINKNSGLLVQCNFFCIFCAFYSWLFMLTTDSPNGCLLLIVLVSKQGKTGVAATSGDVQALSKEVIAFKLYFRFFCHLFNFLNI